MALKKRKYDYDLIVIGGGAAGLTASTGAGSCGAKTLLIEKENVLGGDCLHYGCVPSKSLIKSAYCYNILRESEKYGLPKFDLTPVDFTNITGRIQNIIGTIQKHDSPEWIKEKYNVETAFGQPQFVDKHTIALDKEMFTSRSFVIATGSSPIIPPIEGIESVPYLTNLSIFSLEKLPGSLIILGGGPIGLEMAQAFSRLGTQVTVVQSPMQILPKEDKDIADFVQEKLIQGGVKFLLGTRAVKVEKELGQIKVIVERNLVKSTMMCDALLVATGRKANVETLDLENAGVQYTPKGISVDGRLRTTAKNIYACGDVNGYLQFTHVAGYEGGIAMLNAVLHLPAKADYTKVPWCTYLDPEVASIGYNEKRAREAGIEYTVQKEEFKDNDRALTEGETDGFIKILINKKGSAIGVQIVGFRAGDLIHEWVAVLNGKVSLHKIATAMHAYPTLSEINKRASLNYFLTVPWFTKLRMFLNF